jgi:pimeloyl-ACP methyl ester carboxylesterase
LLNDVGPVMEARGIARLMAYVGKSHSWPTWVHAARALAEQQGAVYPGFGLVDWIAHAKRLYRLNAQGKIMLDYDPKIAEPLRIPAGEFDMWPAFEALGDVPVLITRGAHSDVFAQSTAETMIAKLPQATLLTVANTGHAPLLFEPEVSAAIDDMLGKVTA